MDTVEGQSAGVGAQEQPIEPPPAVLPETGASAPLVRAILLFMAVALPTAFCLRSYDSAIIKTVLLQVGAAAAAAVWFFGAFSDGQIALPRGAARLMLPAALLLAWNTLLYAVSPYRVAAADGFIMQQAFLASFIVTLAVFSRRNSRAAVTMLLLGWAVVVAYGLVQYAGADPFAWKGAFGPRLFSTLANPELLAAYLLLAAPLGVALLLDEKSAAWLRGAAALLSLAGVFLIVETGTQRALVLLICEGAMLVAVFRGLGSEERRLPAPLLAVVCAFFILTCALNFSAPGAQAGGNFHSQTWNATAEMAKTRPLTGVGPGAFRVSYPAFRPRQIFFIEGKHTTETDHAENELLETLAETGLIGALLWLWLFGLLLYRAAASLAESAPDGESIYSAGLLVSVTVSLAMAMLSNSSRFAAPGWHIFFCAGLLGAMSARPGENAEQARLELPAAPLRPIMLIAAPAAALYLSYGSAMIFYSDMCQNMGIYYAKAAAWDQALEQFGRETKAAPSYVMSRYFSGNIYKDRGRPGDDELALREYRAVRSLAPDYVQVHFQEGQVLERLGRIPEAIERLERQTRLDPVWEPGWRELSALYEKNGDAEKARKAAQEAENVKALWAAGGAPYSAGK